ncbi:MAG: helix-turn-helix transcriptional regulator [Candidatus Heimdallarchaeota archaeon]
MHLKSKYYLSIFLVVVLSFSFLSTLDKQTKTQREKVTSEKNEFNFLNSNSDYISLDNLNAISSAQVTCYLHLKTAQVQLDIDFVGVSELKPKEYESSALTTEKVSVIGDIRSVEVVEDEEISLSPELFFLENVTIIQFELSSTIPVGVTRNVKITFIQDTTELVPDFIYLFGLSWMRTIGSHTVNILCDADISLLGCIPSPHTISITGDKLLLTWLEVNPLSFYANVSYTRKMVIDELFITPDKWVVGKIKASSKPLEKVFEITNNENTQLSGTIITPSWISVNVSEWSLSVNEKMFVKVTIDISRARNITCNIAFQCSFASYPVNLEIQGEVTERISITNIILIILSSMFISVAIPTSIIMVRKRKKSIIPDDDSTDEIDSEIPIEEKIDMDRWKEILTDKEFTIFEVIVGNDEMTQSDLVQKTSLSKSTVSRAVGRLVAKGLIKKRKYGMSNIITINQDFFKSS